MCGGALLEKNSLALFIILYSLFCREGKLICLAGLEGGAQWAPPSFPSHLRGSCLPEALLSPAPTFYTVRCPDGMAVAFISAHDFVDRINLHMK